MRFTESHWEAASDGTVRDPRAEDALLDSGSLAARPRRRLQASVAMRCGEEPLDQ
jgi:hypothetical protein